MSDIDRMNEEILQGQQKGYEGERAAALRTIDRCDGALIAVAQMRQRMQANRELREAQAGRDAENLMAQRNGLPAELTEQAAN